MIEPTARALARKLRDSNDRASIAGIRAAMEAGGYDPDTTEPDNPQGYCERELSNARAENPAYLTMKELIASVAAREAATGGLPF